MPRPRSLTRTAIAAAAVEVVDRDGLGGLSMRAVAVQLGTGTMSLYRYVADRDELETLVVDLVLGDAAVSDSSDSGAAADRGEQPWDSRVATAAGRLRDVVNCHPAVVPLLLTQRHSSPASLRWGETVLEALTDGGFTGQRRVVAFRAVLSYVIGAIQVEHYGPLSGSSTAVMAELPASEYPVLVETAADGRHVPAAEEFQGGLAVLLDGLRIIAR